MKNGFYAVYDFVRSGFFFLAWMWGLVFLGTGMVLTVGLFLWPMSSKPIEAALAGLAGVALSIIGASVMAKIVGMK